MDNIAKNIEEVLTIKNKPFEVELKDLDITSILLQEPLKDAREDTEDGLTSSIELLGVIQPIVVVPMEGLEDKYILVDGFRRIFSLTRLGEKQVKALILTFEDKRAAKDDAMILGRVLSNTRKLSNQGLWNAVKHIEDLGIADYTALDALFNLAGGSVVKLKDIMEGEYEEPREDYLDKGKDIDYAKRKLDKLRRAAKREEADEEDQQQKKDTAQVKEELGITTEEESLVEEDYQWQDKGAMIAELNPEEHVMLMKRVSRDDSEDKEVLGVILLPCEDSVVFDTGQVNHEKDYLVVNEAIITQEELNEYKEQGIVLNLSSEENIELTADIADEVVETELEAKEEVEAEEKTMTNLDDIMLGNEYHED